MNRKIIHLDMDAFYASIEERDNPELRGKPVIVGSKPHERGVVSTCNYEARKYGVRSAMSSSEAYRRCPHGVFVHPHFEKYHEVSEMVHRIMEKYTDCIEFLSLDEGYMDVTGSEKFFGRAEDIARSIQKQVYESVKVTCSVGVGYNMLTAKLASEEKKPRGFFVIHNQSEFMELMRERPVGILYGVGKKTEERLIKMGIKTVGQLANFSPERLMGFGIMGDEMIRYANGIDNREVVPNAPQKSIGKETTFMKDVTDFSIMKDTLLLLSREVANRLTDNGLSARTVTLKVKFSDMKSITRSHSGSGCNTTDSIYKTVEMLLEKENIEKPVRLLGVSAGNLTDKEYEQLSFEDFMTDTKEKDEKLNSVLNELRHAYGQDKLKTAKEMLAEKHLTQEYKRLKEE